MEYVGEGSPYHEAFRQRIPVTELYWRLLESSFFTPQPLDGGGGGDDDEAEEAEQRSAPAVAYVVGLPQVTRERQGAAGRASLSPFTEAVAMLALLHARFGGSSGEQAETTYARLSPLVAPLRSAARNLNLSMQAGTHLCTRLCAHLCR